MKKFLSLLLLLLCTLVSLIPTQAMAATNQNTATVSTAAVKTKSNWMRVTKANTPLKSTATAIAVSYAKYAKGCLVEASGTKGEYYKVKMGNGKTYYVAKSALQDAPDTVNASLYYVTKSGAPVRSTPYESGSTLTTLATGTVVSVLGTLTNDWGNQWLVVAHGNTLGYLFEGNAKKASIKLTLTGQDVVYDGESFKLSTTVTPSGIRGITYSSDDSSIVKVDISGKCSGVGPGTTYLHAKIAGIVDVKIKVTCRERAIYPSKNLRITQIAYESYSHKGQNAVDLTSSSRLVAPVTMKIVYIDKAWGYVVAQSTTKVAWANGTVDNLTLSFMHDESVSDLKVGQVIPKGKAFYEQGGMGSGDPNKYGDHVHLAIYRGKVKPTSKYGAGDVYVFDALFIDRSFTTKFTNYGVKESGNTVSNGAPTNYKTKWRYIN